MTPEFHPAAARELAAAVQSGEDHTPGLGAELKAEAQRVTQLLLETPLIGEPLGKTFRSPSSTALMSIGCGSWPLRIAAAVLVTGASGNDR